MIMNKIKLWLCVSILVILFIVWFVLVIQQGIACKERGGAFVEGVLWYECVQGR